MAIDLNKSAETLKVSLQKKGVPSTLQVDIAFLLDVSGSYEDEHKDGSTNILMSKLVPWGMVLDPDKKLDCFTFSDGAKHAVYVGEVTPENHEGFVKKNIIGKVDGWRGGTDYSYVIRKTLVHFGWVAESASAVVAPKATGGFFGFGKKKEASVPVVTPAPTLAKRKGLALLNTDGENYDKPATEKLLKEMQDNNYGVYVLFLAYANGGADLSFIEKMADKFNNCGICKIPNLKKFIALSDEELNEKLVTIELTEWLKK